MKKKLTIIGSILFVIVMAILLGIQFYLNKDTDRMKKEEEIYKTLDLKLSNGKTVKTEYYNIENGKFYIKVPNDFKQMNAETINMKYPNGNKPGIVFTNDKTTVNIAISLTDTKLKNNEVKDYLENVKKTFSKYEILDSDTFERDKNTIGHIKFISKAADTDIYNHMMVFSCDEKLIIVSFNCTKELQKDYQELGDFIINSIMFPIED